MGPTCVMGCYEINHFQGRLVIHFSRGKNGNTIARAIFFSRRKNPNKLGKELGAIVESYKWEDAIANNLFQYNNSSMLDAAKIFLKDVSMLNPGVRMWVDFILREWKKWNVRDLIKKFEANMIYDAHGYRARFERSEAREELCRREQKGLKDIIEHLCKNPPDDFMDLKTAWGHLLSQIELKIDPEKSGPKELKDTEGWVEWAKKFALNP